MFVSRSRPDLSRALWIVYLVLSCLGIAPAMAQTYPTKPLRLIIPFPPGGGNDVVGRVIATHLSQRLGKQVVIDNRGGGGGIIGTEMAANSQPDGYTLLMISATYTVTPWLYKLTYDPVKSFVPVSMLANSANLLAVHPALPVSTVKELIALAKTKPGQYTYASGGVASNPHLSGALFSSLAGIDIVHVPFRGTGPMIVSVVGGQTPICIGPLIAMLPHVSSGRLKALGIGGLKRSTVLPDVPTIAEAGVPGYESSNWWGLMAPAGTPAPIVNKLHAEVSAILNSPEVQKSFASQGAEVVSMTPDGFRKAIAAEMVKWRKVVKDFGISGE